MSRSRDDLNGSTRERTFAASALSFCALVGLVLLAAIVPAGGAAADVVIKDPHGIACPAAPPGWYIPPGDATSTTPGGRTLIIPGQVLDPNEGAVGGNTVGVGCDYFTTAGKHIQVDLAYALPTDPNPISDFYFGCQSGGTAWTDSSRHFRQMSPNQWAAVAFFDQLGQLQGAEITEFEQVARQLLANSAGYAHGCTLKLEPTPVDTRREFSFTVAAGKGGGLFFTRGLATDPTQEIVSYSVPDMVLHVRNAKAKGTLTIRVTQGVNFVPSRVTKTGPSPQQLRLSIAVKKSKLQGCPTGSTGTLIVSTTPRASVLLKVCSQSFLQGKATTAIVGV
jgi:hypothetical protein